MRVQLAHVALPRCSDVELARVRGIAGRAGERVGDVEHEDVVARGRAVAEDLGRPLRDHRGREDRDDTGLTVRVLTRPVDVRQAQRRPLQR